MDIVTGEACLEGSALMASLEAVDRRQPSASICLRLASNAKLVASAFVAFGRPRQSITAMITGTGRLREPCLKRFKHVAAALLRAAAKSFGVSAGHHLEMFMVYPEYRRQLVTVVWSLVPWPLTISTEPSY